MNSRGLSGRGRGRGGARGGLDRIERGDRSRSLGGSPGPRIGNHLDSAAKLGSRIQKRSAAAAPARQLRSGREAAAVPNTTIRVLGLRESKASTNDGSGLRELKAFLERKAVAVRKSAHKTPIEIKRVR